MSKIFGYNELSIGTSHQTTRYELHLLYKDYSDDKKSWHVMCSRKSLKSVQNLKKAYDGSPHRNFEASRIVVVSEIRRIINDPAQKDLPHVVHSEQPEPAEPATETSGDRIAHFLD